MIPPLATKLLMGFPATGVSQHRHDGGLNLEDAPGNEDVFLFGLAGRPDTDNTRLDPRDEWRMPGVNAEFARFATTPSRSRAQTR